MSKLQYLAITACAILFLATVPFSASIPTTITLLTLDPLSSQVAEGDEVTFTGTLRTVDGTVLPNMKVEIVELRAGESITLTSAMTDEKGTFEAVWNVESDSTKEVHLMVVMAIFDGDDRHSASKSSIAKLRVATKDWLVIFNTNKDTYVIDEVATFRVRFFDRLGPIEPDSINALYDGKKVNMTRLGEGVYVYKTLPLKPKFHTLEITVEKHGFEPFSDERTITVFDIDPEINISYDDLIAPTSTVVIDGLYNNQTNWYYGRFPIAVFNATDEYFGIPSGIFHIVVQYMSKLGDQRCTKNAVCYLQPGENITLSRYNSVNHGQIIVRWFAKDNAGNIEEPNKLALYVDTAAPRVSVLNISTENQKNIPPGSNCDKYNVKERDLQCSIIRAYTEESITFTILAQDEISGLKTVYYRVASYTSVADTKWKKVETESIPFPHSISIKLSDVGTYRIQLKATDVAGNESPIKQFVIRITEPPRVEFPVSVEDFKVSRQIGTSNEIYYDISALIRNNTDNGIIGTALVLVQQKNGITEYIETSKILIKGNGESIISLQWTPETVGVYKFKMFVWNNAGLPLSEPIIYDPTLS